MQPALTTKTLHQVAASLPRGAVRPCVLTCATGKLHLEKCRQLGKSVCMDVPARNKLINRWRAPIGTHGAKKESFSQELLKVDLKKLQALLQMQIENGATKNAVANQISDKVLKLIEKHDGEHFKHLMRSKGQKNAIAHTKMDGILKSAKQVEDMDFRVVLAILVLFDEDISHDQVFSPSLLDKGLDFRVEFHAKLKSNDPAALQRYDIWPDPVSILKSTITLTFHDETTGMKRTLSYLLGASEARIAVRLSKGQPPTDTDESKKWLRVHQENMVSPTVLIALNSPLRWGDLFSISLSPLGDSPQLHATIQNFPFQPSLLPWVSFNISEDTEIFWTLLAPMNSVRLFAKEEDSTEKEKTMSILQRALIRKFWSERSPDPDFLPLASSRTVLDGPRQNEVGVSGQADDSTPLIDDDGAPNV